MKTIYCKLFRSIFLKIPFVLLILILFFYAPVVQAEKLSIKGDNVHLRTGPGKDFKVKWEYGSGFPVEILEKKGDWLKIKDFENDTGWVHKSFLTKTFHTIVKANKNSDKTINIRKDPGSNGKIVGMAYYGVVFKVLSNKSGWVEVEHETGLTGWVSSNLLWGN